MDASRIASIEITRSGGPGEPPVMAVFTREGLAARGEVVPENDVQVRIAGTRAGQATAEGIIRIPTGNTALSAKAASGENFDGIILIDGIRVAPTAMRSINPETIESVEILKGAAAANMFDDPKARNGVIRITTKAAARER